MPSSEVMHKFKHKTLRSGGKGKNHPKVHSRAQAIAIMKSEERNESKHGGKYKEGKKKIGRKQKLKNRETLTRG